MRLIKANMSWSAKQFTKMYNNGTIMTDNVMQRGMVWENKRRSYLIHSMIEGFPIPAFYARKTDGKYDFLDGKQRVSAIAGFINNEYYLEGIPEVTYVDENGEEITEDLNDVKFDDLPESVQDTIKDYTLTVYYYENITDEQVRELFKKLNNGKPLSAKERNIANMIDISNISELGKHELFERMLSDKAIDARKQLPIVMKMWAMLNNNITNVSFDGVAFNELVSTVETTEDERNEIVEVMNYYLNSLNLVPERATTDKKAIKKMVNETNVVSLMPFVKRAIDDGISEELFADWLGEIFTKEKTVSYEYQNVCTAGAAKNTSIVKRNEELEKAWDDFFKADSEENDDTNVSNDSTDNTEYVYGMRARGFAPLCQPMNGLVERRDSNTDKYYDILVYNRELTEEEVRDFQFDKLTA